MSRLCYIVWTPRFLHHDAQLIRAQKDRGRAGLGVRFQSAIYAIQTAVSDIVRNKGSAFREGFVLVVGRPVDVIFSVTQVLQTRQATSWEL